MRELIHTEILKLRRSPMLLIAFSGAAVTPLISFIDILLYKPKLYADLSPFEALLQETALYAHLLVGPPLYGVLAAWLIIREFSEGTIASVLAVPVSRPVFLAAKLAILALWMELLSLWIWLLTLILSVAAGFDGMTSALCIQYLGTFLLGGFLLFLLTWPLLLVALLSRNYLTILVLIVLLLLLSVILWNSPLRDSYPWTAVSSILTGRSPWQFPLPRPPMAILCISVPSLILACIRFLRMEIPT